MRFEYPISSPKVKSGCNKNALRFPLELPRCTIELHPRTCPFTSGHPSETLSNFFRYISIVGRSILPAPPRPRFFPPAPERPPPAPPTGGVVVPSPRNPPAPPGGPPRAFFCPGGG